MEGKETAMYRSNINCGGVCIAKESGVVHLASWILQDQSSTSSIVLLP